MNDLFSNEVIAPLIEEMQQFLPLPGNRVFRVLKKLEKEAALLGDDALIGFVYFYYALAYYSRDDHARMQVCLQTAIEHLMRADDEELLARAFNLFALEAQYAGCYDIAQNYFHMAYTLVQDDPRSLVRAILDTNISNLLTESGEYLAAYRRIRRVHTVLLRHKDDVMFEQNLAVYYITYGMSSLYAEQAADAEKALAQIENLLQTTVIEETSRISYLIFRALYAFLCQTPKEARARTNELADYILNTPFYSEQLYDLYNFCRLLLERKATSLCALLIHAIESKDISDTSIYRHLLLSDLRVDYYERKRDRAALGQALTQQRDLSRRLWDEQRQIYLYSIDLMTRMSVLKEEQNRYRHENELLRSRAETDRLTGLPNRYAMNRELEEALSRSLRNGTLLGIGLIDIDSFKQYNDLYGHMQGDQCLRMVANALRSVAQERSLYAARYGGDEFVLLYEDRSDRAIREIAEEIQRRMPVRVTHGFYNAVPDENSLPYALLAKADAEMYRVRRERP